MSVVTDECINAAMTAFYQSRGGHVTSIRAALAAVAPLIAAQERERCALVADEEEAYHYKAIPVENLTSDDPIACPARQRTQVAGTIAAAIRALKDAT